MRYGFITCVELGLSCMEAIYESGSNLELIITLNDDKASQKSGRVYLDEFCKQHKVDLVKCDHVNDPHVSNAILKANIDWLFIIGWSQIAGDAVLEVAKYGTLGMHPTLLPKGRGRAPVPWAIIKGLQKTGVSLFKLDTGVDTGLIGAQIEIPLDPAEDAASLYGKVNHAQSQLMRKAIHLLENNKMAFQVQDESKATFWPGRKPEDGRLDLSGSVIDAERLVRAVTHPYPGAFIHKDGIKVVIWKAIVADDSFEGQALTFPDGMLGLIDFDECPDN
jgi:methionyl-tRNA formyltransferase